MSRRYTPVRSHFTTLWARQHGLCHYCGVAMLEPQPHNLGQQQRRTATIDHLRPLGRGGDGSLENKVLACFGCNTAKGPLTEDEFMRLRDDPRQLRDAARTMMRALEPRALPPPPAAGEGPR